MAKKNLYINDVTMEGIYVTSDTILDTPRIDYEEYSIPGRDGNVIQYNNRLDNVVRKFTCHIPQSSNQATALAKLKKAIYQNIGYVKIASDYEPATYQYGYLAQEINVKPFKDYSTVTFDLYFSCNPMKYSTTSTKSSYNINQNTRTIQTFPRNSTFIQQLLQNVSANDVPDAEAFVVVAPFVYSSSSDVFTDISATFPASDSFIACADVGNYNQLTWKDAVFRTTIGYSVNGNLAVASFSPTENLGELCFVMPADSIGQLDISLKRNSTTYSRTYTFNYQADLVNNTDVFGANIDYEIDMTAYSAYVPYDPQYDYNFVPTVYIVGLSSGKKMWHGMIEINTDEFYKVFQGQDYGQYSTVKCTFNSQTLEAELEFVALNETIKAGEYVVFDGEFGGLCDEIKVFAYTHGTNYGTYRGITKIDMTPRWWTL